MKVFKIILAVAFVFGIAANVVGFEGNGSDMPIGIHGRGAGDGTGPIHNILGGNTPTLNGMIRDIGAYGDGLVIDTGNESVSVYGIGPQFYWDSLGIARPSVGDVVTVNGIEVVFSDGSTQIVAKSITIGEDTIPLRDEKTGLPLWRRNQGNGNGRMKHDYRKGTRHQDCPFADPDSEETL